VAKLVARLLATAALKNTKWATLAKKWPTHSSPQKICEKNVTASFCYIATYTSSEETFGFLHF
jgi:hypothetical protein